MTSSVEVGRRTNNPTEEVLSCYPNPFNRRVTISYNLPQASNVTVNVYNISGQIVSRLVHQLYQEAGSHTVHWDAANHASGTYICKIEAQNFTVVQKMVLIR